jgi:hypothetical protein
MWGLAGQGQLSTETERLCWVLKCNSGSLWLGKLTVAACGVKACLSAAMRQLGAMVVWEVRPHLL